MYYDDLTKDKKRVSIFKKAIQKYAHGITYDLGTGSGILASFASENAEKVYAFEINPLIIKKYAKKFLKDYDNIELIEADVTDYKFTKKPDVVICEMLDTALIDEEQVLAINNVLQYAKEDTIFIPKSTKDTIQVGTSTLSYVTYHEFGNRKFIPLSEDYCYNETIFTDKIDPHFNKKIKIRIDDDGILNSLLITTYTYLSEELVTGPTPMLNPPLLIPTNEIKVNKDDTVIINLEYIMGGGLNTIKASARRIN